MKRKTILFLGDSLTQWGYNDEGFVANISDWYQRRADVFNRGYSGYNSSMVLDIVDDILDELNRSIDLCLICLGANDAVLPDAETRQGVEMTEYAENLKTIVQKVQERKVARIVLMTPPFLNGELQVNRQTDRTQAFANSALEVAEKLEIHSINLFTATDACCLSDGLHLNATGNKRVAMAIQEKITAELPDFLPEALPMDYPEWRDLLLTET